MMTNVKLTDPQLRLVGATCQFPAFVGGFGSGKTQALISRALAYKAKYPKLNIAYYMPTFDLVRMMAFPRFEDQLSMMGVSFKSSRAPMPKIDIVNSGSIIFRTMDTPARIISYEVADSFVDELDTLKTIEAEEVWRRILSRNRQRKHDGAQNTVAVGTTPEGYRFVYNQWKKDEEVARGKGYKIIHASTYSNEDNLPQGYIKSLIDIYPTQLIDAYLNGLFVNMTSGAVYFEFDRKLNNSLEKVVEGDALHIGMDFNVTKMAAVVFVMRGLDPHAVAEFTNVFDTPAMIKLLKSRYPARVIFVYPDATGDSRKSINASSTDLSLLRQAGFNVLAHSENPRVRERVLTMNCLIHSSGNRRFKVNSQLCPALTQALEQQAYDKNGEPDKDPKTGYDHIVDAAGYFVSYRFPIGKRVQFAKLTGI